MTTAAVLDPPADLRADTGARARRHLHAAALVRGRQEDAAWVRPSLIALLALTALLYFWGLGSSGWANAFYSAAVQAGSSSWKAFFFGSFDSSNFITVDKPPASLWVMDVSARIFGVNSWSILVPEALAGVGTVGLVYASVRRWFHPAAALIAGSVVALTPVAALMFRFDNPDALLVLLLTAAGYATLRSLEKGETRWLVLASALIGTGFLTKMMQAFLVVPAMVLVFLIAAPVPLRRRVRSLLVAGVALVAASGWWVAIVELVPASDRPYIGGSQDNSLLNLIFGYNGFGRLTGNESGSVVGGNAQAGSMWGPTGWNRMFLADFGGQIAWLIPAALMLMLAALVMTRRAPRTDRTRAAVLFWGAWLLVTAAVFSYASGIIHPYYTVALAPAIGALVGIGTVMLWQRRARLVSRLMLAATLIATVAWSFVLLARSADWHPLLRVAVLGVGLAAAAGLVFAAQRPGAVTRVLAAAALLAALAGPAAYTVDTALAAHTGAIPSAGPAVDGGMGGPGGFPAGAGGPGLAGGVAPPPGGFIMPPPGFNGGPGGGPPGGFPGANAIARNGGGPGGAAGGLLDSSAPSSALTSLLTTDASRYTWVAATVGANSAAGYQLATDDAVLAIGGFNGTDPTPTLSAFQTLVQQHRIHYFISGGSGGGPGGGPGGGGSSSTSSQISTWVQSHFSSQSVGGVTVYDLTATPSA